MKFPAVLALVAALLFPATLSAHPLYLFGQIGKSNVMATLTRDGDALSGWYTYLDIGKELRLAGRIDATGDFQLDETVDAEKTGHLQGKLDGGHWTGEWRKPDGGSPLPFTLSESRDMLGAVTGEFRCSSDEARQGRLDLRAFAEARSGQRRGEGARRRTQRILDTMTVSKDASTRSATSAKVPTDVGVLLKAKDEDDPITEDSQRCTIRIVGDADTLFLQFGDLTEKNDDCRFSGTTAFCSPRSWMADIIVDRKTKSCKSVGG